MGADVENGVGVGVSVLLGENQDDVNVDDNAEDEEEGETGEDDAGRVGRVLSLSRIQAHCWPVVLAIAHGRSANNLSAEIGSCICCCWSHCSRESPP